MPDTPQQPNSADTPQERQGSSPVPVDLREMYEAYLVAADAALLTGSPLPELPAEIVDSSFREQAESGLRLLQLLSRARECVLGPEAPRSSGVAVPLERVAHFRLLRELGRGGHGVVYLAVDERLGREVALKVPRPETLVNPELRKRFLREAQAAGQLDHPHLVPVHEVGEEGHLVYIASQYIEGPDLAQWLLDRKTPVPPREAAELVADLADGVEHAHAHGVLHRDIKPSNVLLADDGGCNSPRLTDFGLAKLRELGSDQTQTRTGVLLGTPTYMAPELAAGKLREVGPGTDVYGLGAVLYEVLTGRPPFRGESDADTIHQVVHNEPLDPHRLRPGTPRELAAICQECLEKRPEDRYGSAALLAADLRRYLSGQPTLARPATALDRAWKWAKRRPAVAGLSAATIALACLLVTGGLWGGASLSKSLKDVRETNRDLKESNQQLQAANLLLKIEDRRNQGRALAAATNSAQEHLQNNNAAQGMAVLDRYVGSQAVPVDSLAVRWIRRACSGEAFRSLAGTGTINALAGAHSGKLFATGGEDGTLRLWQSSDGALLREFAGPRAVPIYAVAFSSQDDLILSAARNAKLSEVVVWDVLAGKRLAALEGPPPAVSAVAVSPNGRLVAAAGSSPAGDSGKSVAEVRVWEVELMQRSAPRANVNHKFSAPQVWRAPAWNSALSLAFAPDSGMLAVGYGGDQGSGAVGLWRVDTGKEESVLLTASGAASIVFAGDGRRLVAGDGGGGITAWNHPEHQLLGRSVGRTESRVTALAPAPSGHHVFAATTYSQMGRARFDVVQWDVIDAPEIVAGLVNGPEECHGLAALPDGASLLAAGDDGHTHCWNLARQSLWTCPTGRTTSSTSGVAFSPQSTHLSAIQDADVIVRALADGATTKLEGLHEGDVWAAVFGESHHELFTAGAGGLVLRHSLDAPDKPAEIVTRHGLHPPRDDTGNQNNTVRALDYSLETRRLATCGNDGRVQVWDMRGPKRLFESLDQGDRVRDVRLSRNGSLVAAAVANTWVRVWNALDGSIVREWKHREELWSVAFSPDGTQLAVGGDLGTIWLRDLRHPDDEPAELLHGGAVASLDYSTDGHTLASAGGDRPVSLWDPISGSRLLELPSFGGRTLQVRFADRGNILAADVGPRIVMWTADEVAAEIDSSAAISSTNGPSLSTAAPVTPAAYAARLRQVGNLCDSDNLDTAAVALQEIADRFSPGVEPPFEIRYLRRQAAREKQIARGSGGEATCLELSADEGLAVVGTNNGDISTLELPSEKRRVYSVDAPVQALALSRDRKQLFIATRGSPSQVATMELSDGSTTNLGGRWGQVNSVAVSPDGRWLVVGGMDDRDGEVSVHRFDLREGLREMPPLVVQSLGEHPESVLPIQSFAFSPDGRTLAVGHGSPTAGAGSGMVTFWDLETGRKAPRRFLGCGDSPQSLAYSPHGTILAAGSPDGNLRLWDAREQQPIGHLDDNGGPIQCVAFSRDGDFVATGSAFPNGPEKPSQVLLWGVRQRSLAACVASFPRGIFGLEFLKDGQTLLVVTEDRMVRAIPYRDRELFRQIPAHEASVLAMEFDAGGRLITAGSDRALRVWDLEGRDPARSLDPGDESIRGFALAAGSKSLAAIAESRHVVWCDAASGKAVRSSDLLPQEITCVAQAADGAVAVADTAGGIFRWDPNGQRTLDWTAPWGRIGHLVFCDDVGQMAVSSCADKLVFWDTYSGKYQAILEAGSEVLSLAVSPDRKLVAAGTTKGLIRLWSVDSGQQVAATGVGRPVAALAFSADGRTLAAAAGPGDTSLWSVPTLERLLSLRSPPVQVNMLRFAPDNRWLVAGMEDGTIVVWRARP